MLQSLTIRDVVLIEALDLDFEQGLVVITGETGAGKSILLDALGLALGKRASSALVRQGASQASVTASFRADTAITALLAANALDHEPSEPVIVRRTVKSDGGSRSWINDQPVSSGLLRDVGEYLVEIHGQHDDRGLLVSAGHRALLDAFGQISSAACAAAFRAMRAAEDALSSARTTLADADRDRAYLAHAVAELDVFAPKPDEEATLAEARSLMQRGEKLSGELAELGALLEGADGALPKLRAAGRILDRVARDYDPLADALAAIDRAILEGALAEEQVRRVGDSLIFNPSQLEAGRSATVRSEGIGAQAPGCAGRLSCGYGATSRATADHRRQRRGDRSSRSRCRCCARRLSARSRRDNRSA